MNSFLSREEIYALGLKKIGKNVKISKKCSIYSSDIVIGDNVRIDDFCILSGKIRLGNYIHIAAYTALYGGTEGIYIYDYANLSSRVTVYSVNDDYTGKTMSNLTILNKYKNVNNKKVIIHKHVIVGSTSVILPGVELNEGSAFGCFSFINCNSEPWSINVGIPAKKIMRRSRDLLDLELKLREEYRYE